MLMLLTQTIERVKAASDTKVKGSRTFMLKKKSTILQKLKTYTVNLKDPVTLGSGNTSVHFDGYNRYH